MFYKPIQALCRNYKTLTYIHSYGSLLRLSQPNVINKLNFHREINEDVESKLRKQDDVEESFKIIYRAPLKTYIKFSYFTVFGSVLTIIPLISSAIIMNGYPQDDSPVMLAGIPIVTNPSEVYVLLAALFFVTFQVVFIVFAYPLRIYKCKEKNLYIAIFQGLLPWKHRKQLFMQGELQNHTKGILALKDTVYLMKNKRVILIENYFTRPADLDEMMILPKEQKKLNNCK